MLQKGKRRQADILENQEQQGLQAVKAKITRQTEKYGWEFIFLAANIDAVETAESIGIRRERAANYRQTKEGVGRSYYAMSEAITAVRACCPNEIDLEKLAKGDGEQ